MTELTSYFILAFSSLFTLVNPIGLSPVFLSMVDHCRAICDRWDGSRGNGVAEISIHAVNYYSPQVSQFWSSSGVCTIIKSLKQLL